MTTCFLRSVSLRHGIRLALSSHSRGLEGHIVVSICLAPCLQDGESCKYSISRSAGRFTRRLSSSQLIIPGCGVYFFFHLPRFRRFGTVGQRQNRGQSNLSSWKSRKKCSHIVGSELFFCSTSSVVGIQSRQNHRSAQLYNKSRKRAPSN